MRVGELGEGGGVGGGIDPLPVTESSLIAEMSVSRRGKLAIQGERVVTMAGWDVDHIIAR